MTETELVDMSVGDWVEFVRDEYGGPNNASSISGDRAPLIFGKRKILDFYRNRDREWCAVTFHDGVKPPLIFIHPRFLRVLPSQQLMNQCASSM